MKCYQTAERAEAHDRGNDEPSLERVGQGQRSRPGHFLRCPGLLTHTVLRKPRVPRSWALFLTSLLEPLLILTMGVVVLMIVLAVLMPIIEINQLVR